MNRLIYILLTFVSLQTFSQQTVSPTQESCDRAGAIAITSDTLICSRSPVGYGKKQEFRATKNNPESFEKEHNSIWYKLTPEKSCLMEFTVYPEKTGDDYDFMFLECDSPCTQGSELKVLRSNISRNDKSIASITGLSAGKGNNNFVGQGPGNSFSRAVKLKAGTTYYLVLDNVYKNGGGHKIIFRYSECEQVIKTGHSLIIIIKDKETRKPLDAEVFLVQTNYPDYDDTLINNKRGNIFIKGVEAGKYYTLKIKADSFLSYREEFVVYDDDTTLTKTVELQKIEPGKKIVLDNIFFMGGSANILRKSYPALRNLVFILKENQALDIEIQGHVNQPLNSVKRYKEKHYQNLSEARAMAVYDYLIKRGISPDRLSYKGFGYSQMIYPYAKTPEEEQQNRRVEIFIKKM
jgi:outer membrane protein OmpA-like peptidoglycan-associated protein